MEHEQISTGDEQLAQAHSLVQAMRETIELRVRSSAAAVYTGAFCTSTALGEGMLGPTESPESRTVTQPNEPLVTLLNLQLATLNERGYAAAVNMPHNPHIRAGRYDVQRFGEYVPHLNAWVVTLHQPELPQAFRQAVRTPTLIDNLTMYTNDQWQQHSTSSSGSPGLVRPPRPTSSVPPLGGSTFGLTANDKPDLTGQPIA